MKKYTSTGIEIKEACPGPIALQVQCHPGAANPELADSEPWSAFGILGTPEGDTELSDIYLSPGTELVIQDRVEDVTWRRPRKRVLWLDVLEQLEDTHKIMVVRRIPNFPCDGWDTWLYNAIPLSEYR